MNIEVVMSGGSKWIRNITSHTAEELRRAWDEGRKLTLVDGEGAKTVVNMSSVTMMRLQDDEVFSRRRKDG